MSKVQVVMTGRAWIMPGPYMGLTRDYTFLPGVPQSVTEADADRLCSAEFARRWAGAHTFAREGMAATPAAAPEPPKEEPLTLDDMEAKPTSFYDRKAKG